MSNADAAELMRFGASAARWWDPQGPMRPLHALNPVRLAWIAEQCTLNAMPALDVGCGAGLLSEALAESGASVTAIDLAPEVLEVAELHALERGLAIRYRQIDVESLAREQAGQYGLVCCMEMLEHVPDPRAVLKACVALLRPGGLLVLSTLNRSPAGFALGIVAAEYLLSLVPRGTHRYDRFIKPSELAAELRQLGMIELRWAGLGYNPVLNRASISQRLDVNYLVSARKPA